MSEGKGKNNVSLHASPVADLGTLESCAVVKKNKKKILSCSLCLFLHPMLSLHLLPFTLCTAIAYLKTYL
jgi:hypothetical protein